MGVATWAPCWRPTPSTTRQELILPRAPACRPRRASLAQQRPRTLGIVLGKEHQFLLPVTKKPPHAVRQCADCTAIRGELHLRPSERPRAAGAVASLATIADDDLCVASLGLWIPGQNIDSDQQRRRAKGVPSFRSASGCRGGDGAVATPRRTTVRELVAAADWRPRPRLVDSTRHLERDRGTFTRLGGGKRLLAVYFARSARLITRRG